MKSLSKILYQTNLSFYDHIRDKFIDANMFYSMKREKELLTGIGTVVLTGIRTVLPRKMQKYNNG